MNLNILKSVLISSFIIQIVKARYPFAPPEQNNGGQCFMIGENENGFKNCINFRGFYLPITEYSDYSSFSTWVDSNVGNNNRINEFLRNQGCNENAASLNNKIEIFCNYAIYDTIVNGRCHQNNNLNPSYMCKNKCMEFANQLKSICPGKSYSNIGGPALESRCNGFKECYSKEAKVVNSNKSNSVNNSNGFKININNINPSNNSNPNNNLSNPNSANPNVSNTQNNQNGVKNGNMNNSNGNVKSEGINGTGNNSGIGNDNGIKDDSNLINNENGNVGFSTSDSKRNPGGKYYALYTVGFMVPLSVFVAFGFIYYRKKSGDKTIDFEKESYSYQLASNNSSTQNFSEHSISSNSNNTNHKVFSIGLTDPKNVSMSIPITNQNIDIREQDNIATNCVAEIISTATMINAANNANNNIQPVSPNEVNININTISRFNNSSNSLNTNTSNSSPGHSLNQSSYNRKLPSYVINNNDNDELKNVSNISIIPSKNSLKLGLPTQINTAGPQSPTSVSDASPIIDLSLSENDPLLNVKKSNSFYHSSVSSESKKYSSFISPISPIVTESIQDSSTNDNNDDENHYDHHHNHNKHKDGKNKKKQYTSHLLTPSILRDNNIDDFEADYIPLEEKNSDRPSKIFSTDISDINNVEISSNYNNNGISITVDKADDRSSKYSSAKIPLSVMTVVQEFEPRMEDELALQVNDRILLLKVFDDGWAVGLNQMTGKQGVFPMEYVVSSELVKSTNKFASQIEFRNALPSRTQSHHLVIYHLLILL